MACHYSANFASGKTTTPLSSNTAEPEDTQMSDSDMRLRANNKNSSSTTHNNIISNETMATMETLVTTAEEPKNLLAVNEYSQHQLLFGDSETYYVVDDEVFRKLDFAIKKQFEATARQHRDFSTDSQRQPTSGSYTRFFRKRMSTIGYQTTESLDNSDMLASNDSNDNSIN
ncbi:hypothetical protein BDA99DRAFT_544206 [Phascolomyces articulosus]|uniref:Uncharacterized protein n=1 Tax=Phascolomyces articulosus TaxID=60185 RepID=A0AAD5P8J6_9FUNG|nr:hypothetical protein BDA99DRAFT_544206 [Phascolomyces articulosus]